VESFGALPHAHQREEPVTLDLITAAGLQGSCLMSSSDAADDAFLVGEEARRLEACIVFASLSRTRTS
jgi:hypothetical protein